MFLFKNHGTGTGNFLKNPVEIGYTLKTTIKAGFVINESVNVNLVIFLK